MKTLTPRQKLEGLLQKGPFLLWLKQQDPSGRFPYFDHWNCCIAQYLKAHGFDGVMVGRSLAFADGTGRAVWFDRDIRDAVALGRTFGGVIARLEEMV